MYDETGVRLKLVKKLNTMVASIVSIDYFVVSIYAFRISICDILLGNKQTFILPPETDFKTLKDMGGSGRNNMGIWCYQEYF